MLIMTLLAACAIQAPMPPIDARWKGTTSIEAGDVSVLVTIDGTDKNVRMVWRWLSGSGNVLDDEIDILTTQYWPTYACGAPQRTLYVSGLRRNGATVIEKWHFSGPLTSTTQTPPGGGGDPSYWLQPGQRDGVQVLYDAAVEGRYCAAQMAPLRGVPEPHLLVRFINGEVYTIRESDANATLVASPSHSAPAGVISEPALLGVRRLSTVNAGTHVQYGHVYLFQPTTPSPGFAVALIDADRNGVIETSVVIDDAMWQQMGMADQGNWE